MIGSRDVALMLEGEFAKLGCVDKFLELPGDLREVVFEDVRIFQESGEIQRRFYREKDGAVDSSEQMKAFVRLLERAGLV
ncbi:hypothetical protein DZC73_06710 [Albitalea terrae]|uniref:Uncharacterized protein n=2 Tax=Piscinibacter terrae TaxID=2496871 RepID=A0A3N7HZY1_9BURK|nr:hypothetical protein DZC73_06710 [Albitalea terrae]